MEEEKSIIQNENESSVTEKGDWLIRVSAAQIVVCTAFFGIIMLLVNFGGDTQLKEKIDRILSTSLSSQQISEAFYAIKDFIATPAGGWIAFQSQETTENEQTEITSAVQLSNLGIGGEQLSVSDADVKATFAPYSVTAVPERPAKGRISSPFGFRVNPITGETGFHSGIDIAANEGSPITSAFYGKVLRTGDSEISGKFIIMSHSDGFETRYYHCSDILVNAGAVIRQGETIARVGSTGRSTGPHLHFEMRINGVRVNPLYILKYTYGC